MNGGTLVRAAVVLALLSAPAAYAQSACPTASDLEGGIALIRQDPFYSNLMTTFEGGLAEARVMARDGVAEQVATTYEHALTVTSRVGANGSLGLIYANDTAALDDLPRIVSWSTGVTLVIDDVPQGGGTFTARYLGATELTLGPCIYEAWQVRTTLALDGRDPIMMDRYFSPELGLSLGSVTLDANGAPISRVIYDSIEAR